MANVYDAVVIGGGHNGLVAGAYLARSGARTVLLEAHRKVGGAAATEAPWPEAPQFKVTKYSYVMSLMPDTILKDLKLEAARLQGLPDGPLLPGLARGPLAQALRRRRQGQPRVRSPSSRRRTRRRCKMGRVAARRRRRAGADADARAAQARLEEHRRSARPGADRPGRCASSTCAASPT